MFIKNYDFSERLSETGLLEDLDFNSSFKVSIECPTGGGKSFYLLDYMMQRGIPFIFATDTLLLGQRLANRHQCGFYCAEDRSHYEEEQLITVYQHIPKFIRRDTTLIIDEAHSLVTDYSWKREAIEQVLTSAACGYKRIILLSGTPLYSRDTFYEGMDIWRARWRYPMERQLRIVNYAEPIGGIVQLTQMLREKGRGKKVVISLLDKSDKLPTLVEELRKTGVEKVAVINSVSKRTKKAAKKSPEEPQELPTEEEETDIDINENAEYYQDLLFTGRVDAEVIVTTYRQGYDLNGTDYELIIAPGKNKHSYTDIIQMMNRFREMPQLPAYILLNEEEKGEASVFNLKENYDEGVEVYTKRTVNLLKQKKEQADNYRKLMFDRLFSQNQYEKFIYSEYYINHHMISHEVYRRINQEMYGKLTVMKAILEEFHINICKMKSKMTMEAEKKEKKEKKRTRYTQEEIKKAIAEFFKYFLHPEQVGYDIFTKPETTELHKEIRERYELFGGLGITEEQIQKLLEENMGDTEKMNKITAICTIKFGTDHVMKMYRRLLLQNFHIGDIITGEEIAERINDLRKKVGLNEQKKNTAVEFFNLLFKTKRSNMPGSKKMGYRIISKF